VYHWSLPKDETIKEEDNAYLLLVRVFPDYGDSSRGTDAAIKVLAIRRHAVDHAAALRMLPANILVPHVARPFLIPLVWMANRKLNA
jgi:hypothetical protein